MSAPIRLRGVANSARLFDTAPATDAGTLVNAMTIDVEDWYQVSAFDGCIDRADWEHLPSRVERNVDRILDLLDEADCHATWFTLGWVADRFPALMRRIVHNGHELASHGYDHRRVTDLNRESFTADIRRAKQVLEDTTGAEVKGYRAPSFSIGRTELWALQALEECGYRYSSSIYPVHHDHYGMPDAPRFAFEPYAGSDLLELPVTTVSLLNRNWPSGGGGYFRLLPYALSKWSMQRVNDTDRQPCIFYFHPWEIDPDQPRPGNTMPLRTRFRHYVNLRTMEPRIRRLLSDFRWDRVDRIFFPEAE